MDTSVFYKKIVNIQPKNLNVMGTGVPGIACSSVAGRCVSTEADVILRLNRVVHDLLDGLKSGKNTNKVPRAKVQVNAELNNCRVLDLIDESQFKELMDDLENIGEAK